MIRKRVKWFLLATLTYLLICYASALDVLVYPDSAADQ